MTHTLEFTNLASYQPPSSEEARTMHAIADDITGLESALIGTI